MNVMLSTAASFISARLTGAGRAAAALFYGLLAVIVDEGSVVIPHCHLLSLREISI